MIDEDLSIDITLIIDNILAANSSGNKIFTNPTDGILNIHLNDRIPNNTDISITDLSARVGSRLEVNNGLNQLDLSGLQKGMYIIQLKTGDEILRTPIIIK